MADRRRAAHHLGLAGRGDQGHRAGRADPHRLQVAGGDHLPGGHRLGQGQDRLPVPGLQPSLGEDQRAAPTTSTTPPAASGTLRRRARRGSAAEAGRRPLRRERVIRTAIVILRCGVEGLRLGDPELRRRDRKQRRERPRPPRRCRAR